MLNEHQSDWNDHARKVKKKHKMALDDSLLKICELADMVGKL